MAEFATKPESQPSATIPADTGQTGALQSPSISGASPTQQLPATNTPATASADSGSLATNGSPSSVLGHYAEDQKPRADTAEVPKGKIPFLFQGINCTSQSDELAKVFPKLSDIILSQLKNHHRIHIIMPEQKGPKNGNGYAIKVDITDWKLTNVRVKENDKVEEVKEGEEIKKEASDSKGLQLACRMNFMFYTMHFDANGAGADFMPRAPASIMAGSVEVGEPPNLSQLTEKVLEHVEAQFGDKLSNFVTFITK